MPAIFRASADWSRSALLLGRARQPWIPSEEDSQLMLELASPTLRKDSKVVVLGVTPAIIQLSWPRQVMLCAIDASPAMIAAQWRAHSSIASMVACARWQSMPFPDAAASAIVGDGSLNTLPSLAEYPVVFAELSRMLRRDGVLVLRCFVRSTAESVEEVVEAALNRKFTTSAPFRLRLCMALAKKDGGLGLGELLEGFNALFPDRQRLAAAAGWPMEEIERFDMDKGSNVRITFPSESQITKLAAPFFDVRAVRRGSYALAEYCPTIALAVNRAP